MKTKRWPLVILFALPFLLRLVYFLQTRDQPYLQWNFLVAYVNHTFAADLARGAGAPYALYRSPYYPLAVSWIYRLAGVEPMAVRLVQWLLGGAGCLLVYRLGIELLDRRRALVALALASLFVPSIYYEGELLEQSLAGFFVLAAVTLLAVAGRRRRAAPLVLAASILYGAGFLMRPDLILAAPFLFGALLAWPAPSPPSSPAPSSALSPAPSPSEWPERRRRAAAFGAGCVLMGILLLRPHILINVRENDTPVNAAINLYLGNNEQADGHDARFEQTAELPTTEPDARADHMTGLDLAGVRYARAQTGGDLSTVAPYWLHRTARFILSHPLRYARLLGAKALLFCSGYLVGTQKDLYFLRESSWLLRALLWCAGLCFPLGLIFPLAGVSAAQMAGLVKADRAGDAAALPVSSRLLLAGAPLGCLATTLVFFHDARFSQPAWPFLILLAASGLTAVIDTTRARRYGPAALAAALMIVSNADWLGTHVMNRASEEFRAGTMHLEQGDLPLAESAFRRSIDADPGYVPAIENLVVVATTTRSWDPDIAFLEGLSAAGRATPPALSALSRLRLAAGDGDGALRVLRQGAERFPHDLGLRLELSGLLMQRGSIDEALALARRVIEEGEEGTGETRAWAYAGYCLEALGRHDEAVATLTQGLQREPRDLTMLGLLGQAYGGLGRRDEEQASYRKVLAIDPGHPEAAYRLALSLAAEGKDDEALVWARRAVTSGHPAAAALARDLERRQPR